MRAVGGGATIFLKNKSIKGGLVISEKELDLATLKKIDLGNKIKEKEMSYCSLKEL